MVPQAEHNSEVMALISGLLLKLLTAVLLIFGELEGTCEKKRGSIILHPNCTVMFY